MNPLDVKKKQTLPHFVFYANLKRRQFIAEKNKLPVEMFISSFDFSELKKYIQKTRLGDGTKEATLYGCKITEDPTLEFGHIRIS